MDSRGKYLDSLYLEYLPIGGNPDNNDDWQAIYEVDYDHSQYNPTFSDRRLFWPKDKGPDTSDSSEYPGNEHGWIYNQIVLDDDSIYVNEEGDKIDDWLWDGFQFRLRFQTDSSVAYTGPWIDNVAVFGVVEAEEPPITKFEATWTDMGGKEHYAASWNIIEKRDDLTSLDNQMPQDAAIPYENSDFNKVCFDGRKSMDPWDGNKGLIYTWDFDNTVDSNKDGNYTNDADATTGEVEWTFDEFGTFMVALTVTDSDGMIDYDTMIVNCGNKALYDVEIKIKDIFETEDSVSSVDNWQKYGSDEDWTFWKGDMVLLTGAGAKDPEGKSALDFAYRWSILDTTQTDLEYDDLEWITERGEADLDPEDKGGYVFETPGEYRIILEVDDGFNEKRRNPEDDLSPENIAEFSWIDDINITVLDFAKQVESVFTSDLDNNVVEVRYEIAYQALALNAEDEEGIVNVNKTNKPAGSETNRQLKTYIEFTTEKMYDEEGKDGFVWAHIIVIYEETNLPEQLRLKESDLDREQDVVLLYYWDQTFNAWVECDNTQKAQGNDVIDLPAVECNVTHFTTIAPLVNQEIQNFRMDPSIEALDIEISVDTILGGGDKDRDVTIKATIHNTGILDIDELDVKFKDGDVVIGEKKVSNIPGRKKKVTEITWTVKKDIEIGTHTIKVELDPNSKIVGNEDSNDIARKKIDVIEATTVVTSYTPSLVATFVAVIAVAALSVSTKRRKKE
jgi:hypothetical protein